jgi:hydrogenase nickel incorporation protein HypA/HybF
VGPRGEQAVHELGIAQSIFTSVLEEAEAHGGGRVARIGLRIGELSGVNAEALRFSFEVTVQGTALEQAELDIEDVPLAFRCARCEHEFRVVNYETVCPSCGSSDTRAVRGDELQIAYLELE